MIYISHNKEIHNKRGKKDDNNNIIYNFFLYFLLKLIFTGIINELSY